MKRGFIIFISVLAVFMLTSCIRLHENAVLHKTQTLGKDTIQTPQVFKSPDIRTIPQNYSVINNLNALFKYDDISDSEILEEYDLTYSSYVYRSVENVSEYSPIIVVGKVLSEIYYADNLTYEISARTLYDFELTNVLRGDFVTGDIITIEEFGGYIRSENFEIHAYKTEGIIKIQRGQYMPDPQIDERYVLFLHPSGEINGAYQLIGSWMGKYVINENEEVSRFLRKNTSWTFGSLDALISTVTLNPFNAELYNKRISDVEFGEI